MFLEVAESLLLESSIMLKIDTINVMAKLLKLVQDMEDSGSQLKNYMSRVIFSKSRY